MTSMASRFGYRAPRGTVFSPEQFSPLVGQIIDVTVTATFVPDAGPVVVAGGVLAAAQISDDGTWVDLTFTDPAAD